jgi:hypothetical protein
MGRPAHLHFTAFITNFRLAIYSAVGLGEWPRHLRKARLGTIHPNRHFAKLLPKSQVEKFCLSGPNVFYLRLMHKMPKK